MPETAKHTMGPWRAIYLDQKRMQWSILASAADRGAQLADLSCQDGRVDAAEIAANARLMAASPRLLAALKRMVDWPSSADWEEAHAAIAEAEDTPITGDLLS